MKKLLILSICLIGLNCFANHTNDNLTLKQASRFSVKELNKIISKYKGVKHNWAGNLNRSHQFETGLNRAGRARYLALIAEYYDPNERLDEDFRLWLVFHSTPRIRAICYVVYLRNNN